MNISIIRYILGSVLKFEAALMLLPCLVAVIYRETSGFSFVITILLCLAFGFLLSHRRPSSTVFYMKEGFLSVSLSWILLSIFGALPFLISGEIPAVEDALFEAVSGFTTTGSSILTDVEALTHCILFWRSFTHWIGGMGVLVFVLMIIPMKNDTSMHLVRAEVPGPIAGKLVPRMKRTSMILYGIYTVMTAVLVILLLAGSVKLYDSLCLAFGAAGTGGFAVSSAGVAGYGSAYVEVLLGVFMILFGINFNIYYLILVGRIKDALSSEEVRCFLGIIAVATAAITLNLFQSVATLGETLRAAFFQVSSIITTTGFATVDFNLWPEFSKHTLVLLMVIGACAGSTGGGLKVSRVIILVKSFLAEIRYIVSPKSVQTVRLEHKYVDKVTLNSTRTYAAAYMMLVCLSTLLLSLDGYNLITNLTAVLSCINNIGPGLDLVGPMANFGIYSDWAMVLLSLVMLIGRLEIFPIFLLFSRSAHGK